MNKILLALLFSVILTGCATSTPIFDNEGKQALSIDCSKGNLTWGDCYAKAGEVCKQSGYDILNKSTDESGGVFATNGTLAGGYGYTRTLIVRCK